MPIHALSLTQEMDGSKEDVAPLIQQLLQDKAVLLQECFGIQVGAEGHLAALPQLIEGHCPELDRLPQFVLQLARDVDWEDEKQCFKGLAQVNCLWLNAMHGLANVAAQRDKDLFATACCQEHLAEQERPCW